MADNCYNCHKLLDEATDAFYVEDSFNLKFCSYNCIDEYFTPHINAMIKLEYQARQKLSLDMRELRDKIHDSSSVEATLRSPERVLKTTYSQFPAIYLLQKKFDSWSLIVFCTMINNTPGYIVHIVATASNELVNALMVGEEQSLAPYIKQVEQHMKETIEVPPELVEFLEQKKSSLLALLIPIHKASDIQMEAYHLYQASYQPTLEQPDEIYAQPDGDGSETIAYMKSFSQNEISYYYIVVLVKLPKDFGINQIFPVISFPTIDPDLYKFFQQGKSLLGQTKN